MKKIVLIAAAVFALISCGHSNNPVVKVDGGLVQGVQEEDVIVYKGVPFAAPPVGDLRGKELQPVQPWEGVLKADTFRAAALQSAKDPNDPIWYREFYKDAEPEYSEDCMYLNIWAPAAAVGKTSSKAPV
ncbi:MAG: carboxylesterase family protein, partial [Bacteroidales bacterium]|nr:carboxylesterase family protein [Bacteroidales bacterium]